MFRLPSNKVWLRKVWHDPLWGASAPLVRAPNLPISQGFLTLYKCADDEVPHP